MKAETNRTSKRTSDVGILDFSKLKYNGQGVTLNNF